MTLALVVLGGQNRGCSIFFLIRAYRGPQYASRKLITATIVPPALLQWRSNLAIENTLRGQQLGPNRGRSHRILNPNQRVRTFLAHKFCAKFHQNRIKIATVAVTTDRQTERRK